MQRVVHLHELHQRLLSERLHHPPQRNGRGGDGVGGDLFLAAAVVADLAFQGDLPLHQRRGVLARRPALLDPGDRDAELRERLGQVPVVGGSGRSHQQMAGASPLRPGQDVGGYAVPQRQPQPQLGHLHPGLRRVRPQVGRPQRGAVLVVQA